MGYRVLEKFKIFVKTFTVLLPAYWLLIAFVSAIAYLELIYRLWSFKNMSPDYIFPVLFSLPAGAILFLASVLFKIKINRIIAILLMALLTLGYAMQLIYYSIFRTPLPIYSLTGTENALQFGDVIKSAILENMIAVVLLLIPLAFILLAGRKLSFLRAKPLYIYIASAFCIIGYIISIICVNLTDKSTISQYALYYKVASPELSASRLGLMTTVRLDLERLVFGFEQDGGSKLNSGGTDKTDSTATIPSSKSSRTKVSPYESYNIMNINFNALIENEKDSILVDMHKYFSTVKPTKKNEYTGIFKGSNLILITAESFSPYAISPERTPTLYKMSREGFVFNNFYNPVWGVSTSDGEYVVCTGLIPKSGIWSFARSGENYLPFVMGNQFGKLGYITNAYHNHSYKYYKRDISHPNMGYNYKGMGKGLNIKKTWPESDLDMIEATVGEFIGQQPFHTYYITVSGHLNYNFFGNYIAKKNKQLVAELPYSDASKAYIACNMEMEFAIKALIDKLEANGIADNTAIAICADHYPYGLPKECIDELAGHEVEGNFELYKNTFILWKKGMEPIIIDKFCSSLDIIPTLSNLFGLEFDSRLLMGSDILSDTPPLVIFSNRSWITDKAVYSTITNTAIFKNGNKSDTGYLEAMNKTVAGKMKYSAKILETDYYSEVVPQNSK